PPLPIFAPDFAQRLADGLLAATPWIASVREVERLYPNRARLALELRRPVATVDAGAWRYVLDERGVVLHREARDVPLRFDTRLFPVVGTVADGAVPRDPPLGATFPDDEVVAAAQVADELLPLAEPGAGILRAVEPSALEVRRSIQNSVTAPGEVHIRTASGVL